MSKKLKKYQKNLWILCFLILSVIHFCITVEMYATAVICILTYLLMLVMMVKCELFEIQMEILDLGLHIMDKTSSSEEFYEYIKVQEEKWKT